MKLHLALGAALLAASTISAQTGITPAAYTLPDPTPFAATIRPDDLRDLLTVLSSDSLQGRETGEVGQRKAAAFIARQFKALGLPTVGDRNTFFQPIYLEKNTWNDLSLKVGDQEFKNRQDYYVLPAFTEDAPKTVLKDVVFVGYGIEEGAYNDYAKADVQGKAVVIYEGEPRDSKGTSLVSGKAFPSMWSLNWRKKVELAKKKGATMVFIVDPKIAESLKNNRRQISTYGWQSVAPDAAGPNRSLVNTVFVSPEVAKAIFGKKDGDVQEALADQVAGKGFKALKIKSKVEVHLDKEVTSLVASNVLGVIEGSDEKLKKEYVFVTAHYDHLGMSDSTRIFHGADDDGSGTSAVIEIARAFAEAKKKGVGPKRTVVCMLVSGEEKGLLGSHYYTEFPIFPLDKTVADINIDMVGRVDPDHTDGNYVYVIGADRLSSELHEINERNNATYTKLALDYKFNDPKDPNHFYERSDHYNFAEKGIPIVFYFNGTHADYHKVTDTVDKIDFDALTKRAQLAFYTAWDVANRPGRLYVDKK